MPSSGIVIDSLRPYHSLPKVCNTLLTADCVRLAAIKQNAVVEQNPNLSSRIRDFLNTPRILYTGDVISVDARDPLADQTHRYYFKNKRKHSKEGDATFQSTSQCVLGTETFTGEKRGSIRRMTQSSSLQVIAQFLA
ncbi:unnamed protein product [Heligmosomoides polygyrus]|uniref:DDE Tnp4 domain-containing protein n=1 Tax=Heligmosomoides polygyrus TaxID=6339 RepID=A0A183GQA5_HELPZ|nr:unnamed protein product [Heligmosomoides polygyrus]